MQAILRPTGSAGRLRRAARGVTEPCRANPGWIALIAVTLGLTGLAAGDSVLPGDVTIQRMVQDASTPGAQLLADAVNAIGGTLGVCLTAAAIIWWCVRHGHSAAAVVVCGALLLRGANALVKSPVGSPRPDGTLVRVTEEANGYGFPSAHVMGVVLLYGAVLVLASDLVRCRARRCLVQAAAVLVLATIGFGRIHTGAHWPSDVLGAYLYGILGLAGLLTVYRALQTGRLPDPEPAVRAAVVRLAGIASSVVRFVLPMPAVRRLDAEMAPIRVTRSGDRATRS